jgi:YD repeat-containing protein
MKKPVYYLITLLFLTVMSCQKDANLVPVASVVETPLIADPEISGQIYVNGVPLLKKTVDEKGRTTEYFYNENKKLVRINYDKDCNVSWLAEERFYYDKDGKLFKSSLKSNNCQTGNAYILGLGISSYEYDTQNRIVKKKNDQTELVYEYNPQNRVVKTISKNLTIPNASPTVAEYQYDASNNLTELKSGISLRRYSNFDSKRNPLTNNPTDFALRNNNYLTFYDKDSWFGNDFTNYTYSYNKFDLPVSRTSDTGEKLTFTYYE